MTPNQFRSWRDRMGLSIAAAAAALSVSDRQVCRYQAAETAVPAKIAKLCRFLEQENFNG